MSARGMCATASSRALAPRLPPPLDKSNMASETMSSTEEVRRQHEKAKLDLIQLINMKDENLRVISVWGTSGVLQETSIIKMAYDDLERKKKFEYHAWTRIMHPFIQTEFVKNIIEQFYVNILDEATKTKQKFNSWAPRSVEDMDDE